MPAWTARVMEAYSAGRWASACLRVGKSPPALKLRSLKDYALAVHGDVAQLVKCLPAVHEAMSLIPRTT